ncbi:ATP-binding protein [Achromobacter insolitus]|uniref:ATP-binding protein n=1 Tax=Achromobacter insolitus TaxID=217204 RepID=UPI002FE0F1E5
MSGYDAKSCNALEKPYYRPIEAALRWCGLIDQEALILTTVGDDLVPGPAMFPRWPCLRANAERILEATLNNELPYGRDGRTVSAGDQVAKHRITIRHSDLKFWMESFYPGQKPAFLFDEIERTTHAAINADSFRALQAERDALKARIEKAEAAWKEQAAPAIKELEALKRNASQLATTERNTLLIIIAALCKYSEIDLNERGATANVVQRTDDIGAPVSDDTVRKVLGQIPDALATRKKA